MSIRSRAAAVGDDGASRRRMTFARCAPDCSAPAGGYADLTSRIK
jgi:hypothetical protein